MIQVLVHSRELKRGAQTEIRSPLLINKVKWDRTGSQISLYSLLRLFFHFFPLQLASVSGLPHPPLCLLSALPSPFLCFHSAEIIVEPLHCDTSSFIPFPVSLKPLPFFFFIVMSLLLFSKVNLKTSQPKLNDNTTAMTKSVLTFQVTAGGGREAFLRFTPHQFQAYLQHFHLLSFPSRLKMLLLV